MSYRLQGQSRRNYIPSSHRRDGLIEWMKEMLVHSFVLNNTDSYLELIIEYLELQDKSRLKQFVPSISKIHTMLPLSQAFQYYDAKYSISKRRFISPSFNELRHILNLSQVMAIGKNLKLITFDGDQTLYSDGGNFEHDEDLAVGIMSLLCAQVKVAVVTAAGYGLDGTKYAKRLKGLLDRFILEGLTKEQVECFYVFGGECNYLLQCTLATTSNNNNSLSMPSSVVGYSEAMLVPVPVEEWQASHLQGPKPYYWPINEIEQVLNIAEQSMRETVKELNLRAKVLRKDRAVGVYPGGSSMAAVVPIGHGSKKLKREALDELVFRVMEALRSTTDPHPITLPYCVFNGGTDAWLDIGNKSVGVAALQAYFNIIPAHCLHVGDQFLGTGNDIAARETSPCIWIINPRETGKILQHILKYGHTPEISIHFAKLSRRNTEDLSDIAAGSISYSNKSKPNIDFHRGISNESGKLCVYTGEQN